jgi:hypothetical protein
VTTKPIRFQKAYKFSIHYHKKINLFMRINPKEKLFSQPILKVREVVRQAMAERLRSPRKSMLFEEVSVILAKTTDVANEEQSAFDV